MYNEKSKKVNYLSIIIRVVLVILILLLVTKVILVIVDQVNNKDNAYLENNLKALETISKDYFKEMLPTQSGDTKKVYLKDLDKDLTKDIKDKKGKLCNFDKSYISITKLDSEYQYKAYLVCGKDSDYKNTFEKITTTTTTTTTKKVNTTKKTTKKTTKAVVMKTAKVNSVSFNCSVGTYKTVDGVDMCVTNSKENSNTQTGYFFTPITIEWSCPTNIICASSSLVSDYQTCINKGCIVSASVVNVDKTVFAGNDNTCNSVGSLIKKGKCEYKENVVTKSYECPTGYSLLNNNSCGIKATKNIATSYYEVSENEALTVSLNSNGGAKVENIVTIKNGTIYLPTPTREGYNFAGWYEDNKMVNNYLKITNNLSLKAKWIKK